MVRDAHPFTFLCCVVSFCFACVCSVYCTTFVYGFSFVIAHLVFFYSLFDCLVFKCNISAILWRVFHDLKIAKVYPNMKNKSNFMFCTRQCETQKSVEMKKKNKQKKTTHFAKINYNMENNKSLKISKGQPESVNWKKGRQHNRQKKNDKLRSTK